MKRDLSYAVLMVLGIILLTTGVSQAADRALVSEVQQKLVKLGYQPGTADGVVGEKTIQAIRQFHQDNQFPQDPEITLELSSVLTHVIAIQGYRSRARENKRTKTMAASNAIAHEPETPSTRYQQRVAQKQVEAKEEEGSSGFFGGLANLSRRISSGFSGTGSRPTQRNSTTATIGIRGLGAEDLKTAHADLRALKQLDEYRSTQQKVSQYVVKEGLQLRDIDYLEDEKKGITKWLP